MNRRGLFVSLLVIYAIGGPIVGGWLFLDGIQIWKLAFGHVAVVSMDPWLDLLDGGSFILNALSPLYYCVGLVPALIGGAIVASKDAYAGGARFDFVLATGCGVGALVAAFLWAVGIGGLSLALAAVCVLSSLACWKLTRGMVARSGFAT